MTAPAPYATTPGRFAEIYGIGVELALEVCLESLGVWLAIHIAALEELILGQLTVREAEKRIPAGRLPWARS